MTGQHGRADDLPAEFAFDPRTQSAQHDAPRRIEHPERQQRNDGDDREHNQGLGAATRQDAVEHLHHVDRHGQHQQVDGEAEQGAQAECGAGDVAHSGKCGDRILFRLAHTRLALARTDTGQTGPPDIAGLRTRKTAGAGLSNSGSRNPLLYRFRSVA